MFGFGKKKTAPPPCPSNPGIGIKAKVAFANGERTWSEEVDVVSLAAAVFKAQGHSVLNHKTWLEHRDSGFAISPQVAGIQPLDSGGVRTATTIQVNHPTLTPGGVFEYQHSTATTSRIPSPRVSISGCEPILWRCVKRYRTSHRPAW